MAASRSPMHPESDPPSRTGNEQEGSHGQLATPAGEHAREPAELREALEVRMAVEADIPALHRIRMSVRENALSDPSAVKPEHYRRMLSRDGRGWVGELAGRIAGFAVVDLVRQNVWALFVDPAHEGRGVGRALHDAMLDGAFAAGATRLWLSTDPNTRAERFYLAAGWQRTGHEPNGEVRFETSRDRWR